MDENTIIAVSTPPGYGGIGVVRISGGQALAIAKNLFKPKNLSMKITPGRPVLGYICNFENDGSLDEAYLTFFPAPHTYTAEDVVELSCHGSPVILEEVVRLGIKAGARHAHPGEFTLRAYIHGRIDMLQAEAVNDMIRAPSLALAGISFRQLEGGLSGKILTLKKKLTSLLSQIEASIEFPDEGLKITSGAIAGAIKEAVLSVQNLIESYDYGRILAEGFNLAITGRTNVTKSTLFNALLDRDRAIVSPCPGTTRFYLKEQITINGAIYTLIDMAGMASSPHPVEKMGIEKSRRLLAKADGALILLDASRPRSSEDIDIIKRFQHKKGFILLNKMDLPRRMDVDEIRGLAPNLPVLEISALKRINLDGLKARIGELFAVEKDRSEEIILSLRQKLLLEEIREALEKGLRLLDEGFPEELFGEEIRRAIPSIGRLTGEIRSEDVLAEIFDRFCVGK